MYKDRCPALIVDHLSAGYPGNSYALRDASFEVNTGERVGVLGPNGAGKSTLFKAIVGLIPHTSGQISIHGEGCRTSHQMVGYVPQHGEIDWAFPVSVRDVVMMGRTRAIGWFRFPTPQHWRAVDEMLERVGMTQFRHRQIGELSGGQRQRVFIARALAQETDVVLLDEPFSGVDAAAEEEITHVLDDLRDDGVTILIATHDLQAAQNMFDKLLLLKNEVIAYGKPEQVFTTEALQEAYGRHLGVFHAQADVVLVTDAHL